MDYSKWDNLVVSDSDEEEDYSSPAPRSSAAAAAPFSMPHAASNNIPRPSSKFIKLAPGDNGAGLPGYLFNDPAKFEPVYEKDETLITGWGYFIEDFDAMLMRTMNTQMMYGIWSKEKLESPEEQFFKVIKDNWLKKQSTPEIKALRAKALKADLRFKLRLLPMGVSNLEVNRVFRCSGGLTFRALVDRVLLPVMGWVRNYHAWCTIRQEDGAWCMPLDSGAIDRMHTHFIGHAPLDDLNMKVADFFQRAGDVSMFVYDFGDRWYHTLTLEEILDTEEGSVMVLSGEGACPPEDSCGCDGKGNVPYFEAIKDKTLDHQEAMGALNYQGKRGRFDARAFNLEEARQRVKAAISSPASEVSGSKMFNMPLSSLGLGGSKTDGGDPFPRAAGKGTKASFDPKTFLSETVRDGTVKDPAKASCCVVCGSPKDLKLCSGCSLVRYCGRDCQVADWKGHKETCKKVQAERAAKKK